MREWESETKSLQFVDSADNKDVLEKMKMEMESTQSTQRQQHKMDKNDADACMLDLRRLEPPTTWIVNYAELSSLLTSCVSIIRIVSAGIANAYAENAYTHPWVVHLDTTLNNLKQVRHSMFVIANWNVIHRMKTHPEDADTRSTNLSYRSSLNLDRLLGSLLKL